MYPVESAPIRAQINVLVVVYKIVVGEDLKRKINLIMLIIRRFIALLESIFIEQRRLTLKEPMNIKKNK